MHAFGGLLAGSRDELCAAVCVCDESDTRGWNCEKQGCVAHVQSGACHVPLSLSRNSMAQRKLLAGLSRRNHCLSHGRLLGLQDNQSSHSLLWPYYSLLCKSGLNKQIFSWKLNQMFKRICYLGIEESRNEVAEPHWCLGASRSRQSISSCSMSHEGPCSWVCMCEGWFMPTWARPHYLGI